MSQQAAASEQVAQPAAPGTGVGGGGPAGKGKAAAGGADERNPSVGPVPGPPTVQAGSSGGAGSGAQPGSGAAAGPTRRGSGAIRITSPHDGFTLSPDDPPIVVVEGQIDDGDVTSAWLQANDYRTQIKVRDGRFRVAVPVLERSTRLVAETSPASEPGRRSPAITVLNQTPGPITVLALEAPAAPAAAQIEVTASWRPRSDRLEDVVHGITVKSLQVADVEPSRFFYLRHTKPGVYNFVARDRASGAMLELRARLYRLFNGRLDVRDVKPASIGGSVSRVIARMLFPQGVLWEQDEWFSGRSEASETLTKFRFPEGVSWIERKAGLR